MVSVILLKPLYQGNIGSVARAMKNFGFSELVLVGSEIGEEAKKMGMHSQDILDEAKVFDSLEDAVESFDLLVGTTSYETDKDNKFLKMNFTPVELKEKLSQVNGKTALLFGPEDSGLTNDELSRCDMTVSIPTTGEYRSMNLSHAVAVLLYELSSLKGKRDVRIAGRKELDIMRKNIEEIANLAGHTAKEKIFNEMVGKIIGRSMITGREASTLIGFLKKVKGELRKIN